jgi:hypothetical protein
MIATVVAWWLLGSAVFVVVWNLAKWWVRRP